MKIFHSALNALFCIAILSLTSCKTESVIQSDSNQLNIEVGKLQSGFDSAVLETESVSPFRSVPLAPPSLTRNAKGSPTKQYWQQRADYFIDAELDTNKHRVKGKMRLRYFNFSPDALGYLWLQLDQNQLQPNGRVKLSLPEPEDMEGLFSRKEFEFDGGVTLTNLEIQTFPKKRVSPNMESISSLPKKQSSFPRPLPKAISQREMQAMESFKDTVREGKYRPGYYVNDTMLRVDLIGELNPNDSLEIVIMWEYPIQLTGRTGREELSGGWVYQIAQWYPRMCVYDDINGWNTQQYYGTGEFYTEFGNFDVNLTVPATHICLATGTLQNPNEVLTPLVQSRLESAKKSEQTVTIVGENERSTASVRPRLSGMLTWRYAAKNVRDFAWASSAAFIWDAAAAKVIEGSREKSILAASLYPKEAAKIWKNSTQMVRESLIHLSRWMPYPYETMINVNGAVPGGMEYPMMIFCRERLNDFFLYTVTLHEIGHTWFPMVVQNDERRYAWMDEGLNSFLEHYGTAEKYPDVMARVSKGRSIVPYMLSENHQPLMTRPEEILDLGANAYDKAALSLITLREDILGPEKFDFAFKEYIEAWKYKHPQPSDFFRTIENAAGEDLSWFWRGWYYTTALLDQSIDTVIQNDSLGKYYLQIELRNLRTMIMPVKMELTFEDGTKARKDLPVEIWFKGNRFLSGFFTPKKVKSILLDPDSKFPDINSSNNVWNAKEKNSP